MFDELDQLLASDTFAKEKAKSTLKLKEGERREVCILFADVKGFTELSETLDHEEVKNILDKLMQLFSVRIKHYGGYIDKYEGDLIMALFGAKIASERDTERAIHAGLQMLEVLDQFNLLLGKKLGTANRLDVRIGINTGWVTTGRVGEKRVGDFTVYGDAVNLASRMESNAPVNRIMLPEKTMLIVKDAFEFEDHGEITVKGKSQPVSVFLVEGLKAEVVHRWQTRRSAYVGRDKELAFLDEKYELVKKRLSDKEFQEYKPTLIGIRGEAGLGKSRLADEFLKRKPELPFYLHGTTPRIAQSAYGMFTSLMRRYFGISQIDDREMARQKLEAGLNELEDYLNDSAEIDHIREQLPILGRLLGVPYEDVRLQLEPKELQPHLQTATRFILEALAAKANRHNTPLVIVLEDLQWLDEPSTTTLEFLMLTLNLEEKRKRKYFKHLLILLTYRPEYEPSRQMKIDADYHEIELTPISEESGEELIRSMAGDISIPEKTLRMVMDKSAGNPFYIEEWVNLVLATSEPDRQKDPPVPDTLHALVLSRIDRLEHNVKLLLQKAAVIGREFFVKVLSEMEKRLERQEDITEHLEHLESGDFVLPSVGAKISAYLFKHIITQEVAYNTLLIANRKVLHRIAAEVIEELFAEDIEPHYSVLAEHYMKAYVKHKALEFLKKAADYAKDQYQYKVSILFYDKLRTLLKEYQSDNYESMNIDVLKNEGVVFLLTGDWVRAGDIFEQGLSLVEKNQDKSKIAEFLGMTGWQLRLKCDNERAMEYFNRQLQIYQEMDNKRGISDVKANMAIIYRQQGKQDEALDYFKKSLILKEELGDNKGISIVIGNMGLVYSNQGDYSKAMECYKKSLRLKEEFGDKLGISVTTGNMGLIYRAQGDYSKAMECFEKDLEICKELGDKHGISVTLGNIGIVHYAKGNYRMASEYIKKQLNICEELGDKRGISKALGSIGILYIEQGDFGTAIEYIKKQLNICEELGDRFGMSTALLNTGNAYYYQGNYSEAMSCYKKSLKIKEELSDKRGLFRIIGNMGMVLYEQENYERALECLEQAIGIAHELNHKIDLPSFLLTKARILLKHNHLEDAQSMCQECLTSAKDIKDSDSIFESELLLYKVLFTKGETDVERNNVIEKITDMLAKTENKEHQATLHYELWQMHNQLGNTQEADSHRKEALKLYKALFAKKPKYEFKKRLEELEGAN